MSMEIAGGGKVWNYREKDSNPTVKKNVRARLWKMFALVVLPTAVLTAVIPWGMKKLFPAQPASQGTSIAGGFGDFHMETGAQSSVLWSIGTFAVVLIFMVIALYKLDVPEWFNTVSMISAGVLFLIAMSMNNAFMKPSSAIENSTAYETSFSRWADEQYGYTELKSQGDHFEAKNKEGNSVSVYSFKMNNNTYLYENIDQLRLTLDKIDAAK